VGGGALRRQAGPGAQLVVGEPGDPGLADDGERRLAQAGALWTCGVAGRGFLSYGRPKSLLPEFPENKGVCNTVYENLFPVTPLCTPLMYTCMFSRHVA
jgi:hypothetical protein